MRMNKRANPLTEKTHEGAPAFGNLTLMQQLRRSVLSCFLFEKEFYEDGQSIADRIVALARAVDPVDLAALAVEARHKFHLRHAPLLLLEVLTHTGASREDGLVRKTIEQVITRADELAEFVALYWNGKKHPLSGQTKKGLAAAIKKFDAYQLAKYNRDYAVKLRDVMFMVHPKPVGEEQAGLWKGLAEGKLESPDTWEVELSAGKDKKETFERLLREGKLGYLALLRNLRNMVSANVDLDLIRTGLEAGKGAGRVLPFRFVAAARAVPQLEPDIDKALLAKIDQEAPLSGKTIILVDVSASMDARLSAKSDLKRIDAAAALASIPRGDLRVFSFSYNAVEVPPRRGMAGIDAIINSQSHGGTNLGSAVAEINQIPHDRLIVVTDEQSHDHVPAPVAKKAYLINVASYQNGVGYGPWTHIDGFSERVFDFIREAEDL